jgi:hypothetical protein
MKTAPKSQLQSSRGRLLSLNEIGQLNFINAHKVALKAPAYITFMVCVCESIWQLDVVVDLNRSQVEFESM